MAISIVENSVGHLCKYTPMWCDTHFIRHIQQSEPFLSIDAEWVELGSVLEDVSNGMNVGTEHYSMEQTDVLYISVSQIDRYGLSRKNQNFLSESVLSLKKCKKLAPNMIVITRSGSVGIALSTNHNSFEFDKFTYIPSGFVIVAKVKDGVSADVLADYLNLKAVQNYLFAMAAGACQKNISQEVVQHIPIPQKIISPTKDVKTHFEAHHKKVGNILSKIKSLESELDVFEQERDQFVFSALMTKG